MNPFKRMAELVEQGREHMASTETIMARQDAVKSLADKMKEMRAKTLADAEKKKPKPKGSN